MSTSTLIIQTGYNHYVLKKNLEGLSHEDSLIQPAPGGNCLNWVLGHIVASRGRTLTAVGEEPIWGPREAASYERSSDPITNAGQALPLERILADLDASQEKILAGLQKLTDEDLAAKSSFSPSNNEKETIGSLLAGLLFHEAYHAGQTGLLRRLIGKDGALT